MDPSHFSPLSWLVAGQFALYALGWGLFSVILRDERAAVVHWGVFMLLMGLGFVLASGRGEERAWLPYVGANLAYVTAFAGLRRGIALFMRAPPGDRELLISLALVWAALLAAGPGAENAPWRVVLSYAAGAWMLGRAVQVVGPPAIAEFGRTTLVLASAPAVMLIVGFSARIARQVADWSHPLEMQLPGGINQGLMYVYLVGAAMFNFSFMAMVTLRLVKKLREQVRQDPLTGLPNRRALEHDLQSAWQRFRAGAGSFAVLALDLDHFKRVNDVHGHLAGDVVLEQVGRRLRAAVRERDIVARTGGEEFVVLMPGAGAENAQRMAQRLIEAVRAQPFELPGLALPLTISVGLAQAHAGDNAVLQVMKRADEALYRAKSHGRDCVAMAAA